MKKFAIFLLIFLIPIFLYSTTWYVRPAGGDYGAEDGTSYADAWDGLLNVVFDTGGVVAGDTLYICGTHIHIMTDAGTGWSWQANISVANTSGSSGNRIVIRGDYPGDAGIIWGAFLPSYESWVSEGSNTYSINTYGDLFSDWFYEDISDDSYTLLDIATSVQNCKDTAGSFYRDIAGAKIYVHRNNGADPTGNVYFSKVGYEFTGLQSSEYLTFLNLHFHHFIRMFSHLEPVTNMRWEGCEFDMGAEIGFLFGDGCHDNAIVDCELSWFSNAVYNSSSTNDSPYNYIFSGNTVHDIGVRTSHQNADAHAFGIQGGYNGIVEDNYCYNCGTAIQTYVYSTMTITDVIIRRNFIKDGHTYGGANGRGIDLQCSNTNELDKSGFEVYQNIVSNCTHGIRSNYEQEVEIYNNIMHNCTYGFSSARNLNGTLGANVKLRNNVFLSNSTYHIYWVSGATSGYTVNSDYNLFYPSSGDDMYFAEGGGAMTFAEWQGQTEAGCTFDPNPQTTDPVFVNAGGSFDLDTDFQIPTGSPCKDAGVMVGLGTCYFGVTIPSGSDPDIGVHEYDQGDAEHKMKMLPGTRWIVLPGGKIIKKEPSPQGSIHFFTEDGKRLDSFRKLWEYMKENKK